MFNICKQLQLGISSGALPQHNQSDLRRAPESNRKPDGANARCRVQGQWANFVLAPDVLYSKLRQEEGWYEGDAHLSPVRVSGELKIHGVTSHLVRVVGLMSK